MTERTRCESCGRMLPRLKNPPAMAEVYGRALKDFRASLGWTQAELAELLGVVTLTVVRWETNKAAPHRSNLDRIHRLAAANGRRFR